VFVENLIEEDEINEDLGLVIEFVNILLSREKTVDETELQKVLDFIDNLKEESNVEEDLDKVV
jgi:hypothetical protein